MPLTAAGDVLMPKILLIDDEPVLRMTFRHFLEGAGYEVVEASDGREGVEICDDLQPDLVITDMFMPDMDGRSAVHAIRRRFDGMPIIVISGQCNSLRETDIGCEPGMCFLPKPVEKPTLLSMITLLLAMKDDE